MQRLDSIICSNASMALIDDSLAEHPGASTDMSVASSAKTLTYRQHIVGVQDVSWTLRFLIPPTGNKIWILSGMHRIPLTGIKLQGICFLKKF